MTYTRPLKTSSVASYEAAVSDQLVVGIHGIWYDLTSFVDVHPGGDLLWKFNGLDASEVFTSFHPRGGVLSAVAECKVGKYHRERDEVKREYGRMTREFAKAGYMSVSLPWVATSLARIVCLFGLVVYLALYAHQFVLGGLALALFWQQCGGYLHDAMHSNLTYNMTIDRWLGWLFGTVATGINADWWKREHDLHHALVNAYTTAPESQSSFADDYGVDLAALVHPTHSTPPTNVPPGPSVASTHAQPPVAPSLSSPATRARTDSVDSDFVGGSASSPSISHIDDAAAEPPHSAAKVVQAHPVDIQMKESVWAQTLDVVPLFPSDSPFTWILEYQAAYFLPVVFFLGRIGILLNAWRHERSFRQWFGLALHAAGTWALCSRLPSWYAVAVFYAAAAMGEGILHLQLIVNHYLNAWDLDENIAGDFIRWTCQATHNVVAPQWLDWFHVGLHLHIEHHLYPKVARCHFRAIQPAVKAFVESNNMPYREIPFYASPALLYKSMKHVSDVTFHREKDE